tara:strand:+ start:104 stop:607 length:504 start_codon:yes stop_codon:yes gene_type:complete
MGLKTDLIDAKIEGMKLSGANDEAILKAQDALETQCQLEEDAIVNFLTNCQFRVTNLAANVILEDFKIPPQRADIQSTVTYVSPSGAPTPLTNTRNGVLTKEVDVNKSPGPDVDGFQGSTGLLQSTGYVYIGGDPGSQDNFDVEDEDGIRTFTSVKLFREDIEDLLG